MNFYEKAKLYAKSKLPYEIFRNTRGQIKEPKKLILQRDWEDIKIAKQMFREGKRHYEIRHLYSNYEKFIEEEDRAIRRNNYNDLV
jgi:hypothetical protein